MSTKVVNVKVKCIRPEYQNLKEWMDDENNLYIGRKGIIFIDGERFPKKDSIWANKRKLDPKKNGNDREEIINLYEKDIRDIINKGEADINELRNKNLGCWCKEDDKKVPCHGDVLIKILNEIDFDENIEIVFED